MLIDEIKEHEMLRRWAISEVYVEFLNSLNGSIPQRILELLNSNAISLEEQGIARSLKMHHLSLVDCLPKDVSWYLASLEITINEFDKLKTLPVECFEGMTNNTYFVSDAAKELQKKTDLDFRINSIKKAIQSGSKGVQWIGITLLAASIDGPFTIIEGNGRLISLYQLLFLENDQPFLNNEVEVVLGITKDEFKIGYKYID